MKENDFLDCVSNIDDDVVERFVSMDNQMHSRVIQKAKRNKIILLRAISISAALILVASIAILIPMFMNDGGDLITPGTESNDGESNITSSTGSEITSPPDNSDGNIPIINILSPSLTPKYYGTLTGTEGTSLEQADQYCGDVSVIARSTRTLPDTYTFFDDHRQIGYRLIEMEVIKPLQGADIPHDFYYLIPEGYMTDYSNYDSFVLIMGQYGFGYSVLYNQTTQSAERIEKMIFGNCVSPQYLDSAMMAFNESGTFDISLWESTEKWLDSTKESRELYNADYTLLQAESDTAKRYPYGVISIQGLSERSEEYLSYVKDEKNGLFIPQGGAIGLWPEANNVWQDLPNLAMHFSRYINGFSTNEFISLYNYNEPYLSEARFSSEDMKVLPDLTSAIAAVSDAFASGEIAPPHILEPEKFENTAHGIFGWYAKTTNGKIIGVIRVDWKYESSPSTYQDNVYYDDAYYIVEYGSHVCTPIERDTLLEILGSGNDAFIYSNDYCEYGKDLILPDL